MYLKRLLAFLCCFTLVFCLFPSSAFATGGNGNIDGGGGSMGHGTSSNFWNSGKEVYLSTNEFEVLYLLQQSPQTTFTKEQIYEKIWHEPTNNHLHAVENTIFQIRKRLKPYCKGHEYIKTVIGYGYKFNSG